MSIKTEEYETFKKMMTKTSNPLEIYKKFMDIPIEKKQREVHILTSRYPSKLAVIVHTKNKQAPLLKKCKFLVDRQITISEFMHIIRKYMDLQQNESIFLFTESNTIPPSSSNFDVLYKEHKNQDGFLYLEYSVENTFG
jgi:GABA(A) receptor-associated protein